MSILCLNLSKILYINKLLKICTVIVMLINIEQFEMILKMNLNHNL